MINEPSKISFVEKMEVWEYEYVSILKKKYLHSTKEIKTLYLIFNNDQLLVKIRKTKSEKLLPKERDNTHNNSCEHKKEKS